MDPRRVGARHKLRQDDAQAQRLMDQVFPGTPQPGRLHLLLRGTNFQLKVWEALLRLPPGQRVSYTQLAAMAGTPKVLTQVSISRQVASLWKLSGTPLSVPTSRTAPDCRSCSNLRRRVGLRAGTYWK